METLRPRGGRREQVLHGAHRTVVEIRRARPDARQTRRPIFLRAAQGRRLRRPVAGNLQLVEELIESVRHFRRENVRAVRIGSKFPERVEPLVGLRSVVTGGAMRVVKLRAASGRSKVNHPRIARRTNSLRQIGLAFYECEIQEATMLDERRA